MDGHVRAQHAGDGPPRIREFLLRFQKSGDGEGARTGLLALLPDQPHTRRDCATDFKRHRHGWRAFRQWRTRRKTARHPATTRDATAAPQRRLTYDVSTSKITVEREELRTPTVLERLHRRRGYNQPYGLEDTWGFTVDVAVVTMVFWSLSGVWLAWELKTTRVWGVVSFVVGLGLFVAFAALI